MYLLDSFDLSLSLSLSLLAVTCFCVSVELSTVVLCLFFEVSRLFGGFFASPKQISSTIEWSFVDVLNYMKYVFVGVALNELNGLELSCEPGEKCQFTTGEEIAAFYGYNQYSIGFCVGILIVLIVGFRLLAYLGLRFIKI
jgi:ATP-binding cassette subfamily G (WHITE) protein 2